MAYLLLILAMLGMFAFSALPEKEAESRSDTASFQEQLVSAKEWTIDTAQEIGSTVRTKALGFLREQLHAIIDEAIQ